ncbi:hypothetical protein OSCI_3240036 [Kamptonema sp. PCC 6506]|nr:hypothetical protein OSCI_3240036 [Kamptonema sp. PCC 6506]
MVRQHQAKGNLRNLQGTIVFKIKSFERGAKVTAIGAISIKLEVLLPAIFKFCVQSQKILIEITNLLSKKEAY